MAQPVHRTIVVADVEGFGDHSRTNIHQVTVREGLYRVLRRAFDHAGVPWDECDHHDRGDAVFILAPATTPKTLFVDLVPDALAAALREYNARHPAEEQIRLRMAVHAGEVTYDPYGVTAASVNLTFRLVDCQPVKTALGQSPGMLAVITSEWFFDEVVRHSGVIDPATYRPVQVDEKETSTVGWISLPDHPYPPNPANLVRPIPARRVGTAPHSAGPIDVSQHITVGPMRRSQFSVGPMTINNTSGGRALIAAIIAIAVLLVSFGTWGVVQIATDGGGRTGTGASEPAADAPEVATSDPRGRTVEQDFDVDYEYKIGGEGCGLPTCGPPTIIGHREGHVRVAVTLEPPTTDPGVCQVPALDNTVNINIQVTTINRHPAGASYETPLTRITVVGQGVLYLPEHGECRQINSDNCDFSSDPGQQEICFYVLVRVPQDSVAGNGINVEMTWAGDRSYTTVGAVRNLRAVF
ncbi:MAG TPA: hypothetical protein VGX25_01430 [Actinophytocola sp.]|uniref:hypothetical protein n=1 Tax=Actinophytocola sp. TaxID=1872138 RepID=UPI002DDCE36C|nr:hypothetical protein [Actinophytocola sp.]HEV2778038.1 hypothetical protein [Actinophytocola sp.]